MGVSVRERALNSESRTLEDTWVLIPAPLPFGSGTLTEPNLLPLLG